MWMILDRIGAAYSSQYTLTVTRAENGERRAWGASVTRHAAVPGPRRVATRISELGSPHVHVTILRVPVRLLRRIRPRPPFALYLRSVTPYSMTTGDHPELQYTNH